MVDDDSPVESLSFKAASQLFASKGSAPTLEPDFAGEIGSPMAEDDWTVVEVPEDDDVKKLSSSVTFADPVVTSVKGITPSPIAELNVFTPLTPPPEPQALPAVVSPLADSPKFQESPKPKMSLPAFSQSNVSDIPPRLSLYAYSLLVLPCSSSLEDLRPLQGLLHLSSSPLLR